MKRNFTTKASTSGSTTKVVASTGNPDRYADIVVWDKQAELDSYMANPVVQFGHNYDTPPIGKTVALDIDQRTGDLIAEIRWDDSPDNPLAQTVARQFREGYMSAVSVGFQPGESVPRNRLPKDHAAYGERGSLMTAPRLLEISAVPVPANAEALAIRGIDVGDSDIVDLYDDEDTFTVVFRKLDKPMGPDDDDEDEAAFTDDDEDEKEHDPEHPGMDDDDEDKAAEDDEDEDEMGYGADEDEDKADDDDEEKQDDDEDESPASVKVTAPNGYHWMDYEGGPVLMAGEDAQHDGAMDEYAFEVVSEHDPDRMKQTVKGLLVDLIANDPSVRMMLRQFAPRANSGSTSYTPRQNRNRAIAGLFGIDT